MSETKNVDFGEHQDQERLSKYRSILLKYYPNADLLPVNLNDQNDVDQAVKNDLIGDTLFSFLWRELSDDCDNPVERVSNAVDDLLAVMRGFQDSAADQLSTKEQLIQPSP